MCDIQFSGYLGEIHSGGVIWFRGVGGLMQLHKRLFMIKYYDINSFVVIDKGKRTDELLRK